MEHAAIDALVRVADVFRHQRQQDFFPRAIRHLAGEQVEEQEKRGLSAAGDGGVFRADIPAEGVAKKPGNGFQKAWIPLRRVVNRQRLVKPARFLHQRAEPPLPDGVHFRNARRLAAAEHLEIRPAAGKGVAEIVHQLADSTAATEVVAKF